MKKIVILFVTLLVCVAAMSSLISIYAYCEEENITTDETNVDLEEENGTYSSRSTIIEGGGEINGELWYGIKLDTEGKPIITYDIDYTDSHLLEYLKPGDVVFERNAGFDVVDFLGHIAMVIKVVQATPTQPGYVLMIESLPSVINNPYTGEPRELGVCYSIMTPTRFSEKRVSIMRVKDATDEQIQGAVNWAVLQLDRAWRFPVNKFIDNNDPDKAWYCSELVWAAYCLQDIDLVEYNILPVAPEDIYKSDEVATILDYRWEDDSGYYETTFDTTDTHHTFNCDGDTYTEEHDYVYESINNQTHSVSCFCGYTSTEAHDYETYNFCYEKCSDCGNVRQAKEHSYTYRYEEIDTISHYSYCECGKQRNDLHNFKLVGMMNVCENCNCRVNAEHVHSYTYTPRNDGKNHIKECSCGIFVMEQCLGEMSLGGQSLCSKCGQVVRSGIGILSDEDDDALPFNKEDDDYSE